MMKWLKELIEWFIKIWDRNTLMSRWVIAHATAGAVGSIPVAVFEIDNPFGWIVYGAGIGFAQWLVLNHYLQTKFWWVLLTALGWSAFCLVWQLSVLNPWLWVSVGLAIGIFQWPLLRKLSRISYLWIPANAFAWVLGFFIAWIVVVPAAEDKVFDSPGVWYWVFAFALLAIVSSLVTGFTLTKLQGSPRRDIDVNGNR